MKIVNILGGLGNQMFEYAMYLALRQAHPEEEIVCCTRSFRGYGLHNGYELDRIFGVRHKEATLAQLARLAWPFWNYRTWQVVNHLMPRRKSMALQTFNTPFDKKVVERTDSVFYDGYWQDERYFKDIRKQVLEVFSFPSIVGSKNEDLVRKITSRRSVSCHVRRGDYLKNPHFCVCTPEYYTHAIKRMNDMVNPEMYCVFSDDTEWCKENLASLFEGKEVVYVDWNKGEESYRDMQLMSLCKHNIIANSSFSWWGAWLNQNMEKVVVTPEKWMNVEIVNDPICDSWIRIK